MEVEMNKMQVYSSTELNKIEAETIESLRRSSQQVIPDPDEWLTEELGGNIIVTTVDFFLNWARRSSLWTALCFPACCAMEFMSASASRFDLSRFGMEILRASPRQADLSGCCWHQCCRLPGRWCRGPPHRCWRRMSLRPPRRFRHRRTLAQKGRPRAHPHRLAQRLQSPHPAGRRSACGFPSCSGSPKPPRALSPRRPFLFSLKT